MKLVHYLKEYRSFVLFVVLIIGFRSAIADWNYVPSGSMEPTLLPGDEVFVNKMAYDIRLPLTHIALLRLAEPQRGDIITFESEVAGKRLVKRVVGVAGDEIELHNNRLFINGESAEYSDLQLTGAKAQLREHQMEASYSVQFQLNQFAPAKNYGPVIVPKDHLLVLGDNRDNSADSRYIGFVPLKEVTGRVISTIASLDIEDRYQLRWERFAKRIE
jgi:signal peptidase I